MNKILVYQEGVGMEEWMEHFRDTMYRSQMRYLASDLIEEGMVPEDLDSAIQRGITAVRSAGLESRKHFMPVYTTNALGSVIRDCKTTKLGLAMILLNGNPNSKMVASWQIKVLTHFLSQSD